jgi:hypothetical protein
VLEDYILWEETTLSEMLRKNSKSQGVSSNAIAQRGHLQ